MDGWPDRLAALGFPGAERIGAGTEGVVYRLGDELVAKVWHDGRPLEPLAAAYAEVAAAGLPFATPRIERIERVAGRTVSVERRLTGVPLSELLARGTVPVPAAYELVLEILAALAAVPAGPAVTALPVLGEATSPWWPGAAWGEVLGAVLARRVSRFGGQLRPAVPGFDRLLAGTYRRLTTLPARPDGLLHGDLCLPNVLVGPDGRVSALLDWGLLTTRGDPAFDAASFPAFFDMYSPRAREHTEALTAAVCRRFGHDRDLLLLYRAWYALVGSNLYDPLGRDGHFAWCVRVLADPEIVRLLR
ncbi:phosphotransferase family protein [Actinocatenispora comari]|uniref:Aminoglycoside phosphotransferase domain-containing protein n=1 Tax=Actinocatenispora comari TaxID=2807577 RepID=A0A8J4AHT4_9ACTN|nr:aminoglycoside phosphotransferase family protein [Actinocatenispora comari]GIL29522.1 hypothetical protein NUM_47760 [Actinocatenispora comari]